MGRACVRDYSAGAQDCLIVIKAWHQLMQLRVPLDCAGDNRHFTHMLGRFQGRQRRLISPIYAQTVRSLLHFKLPAHPPCRGTSGGCSGCCTFLHCAALTNVVC